MDIESSQWDEWEAQFRELAKDVPQVSYTGAIKGAKHYLCLYGENGLNEEEEFEELALMRQQKTDLKRVEVDTAYWQDTVLFIPAQ